MKKIICFMILFLSFSFNVAAKNTIYSIDMDIYIDENANASITEKWHVKGDDGTEWYKPLRDLGNSNITNFTVSMDGNPLQRKNWNINESLEQKRGYYGINYNNGDTELCFGKFDYNEHVFTLKYNISNYIFNTNDSQVMYWTLNPIFQNVNFEKMNVTLKSFYSFPDTLDVWGYGYKGYAYVKDGVIEASNSEDSTMNNNYMVLLVKFPSNTFKTTNYVSYFQTFDDVYKTAEEGTFKYDYNNDDNYNNYPKNNTNFLSNLFNKLSGLIHFLFVGGAIFGIGKTIQGMTPSYGYKNNKTINKKEVPNFRDIPCDKNIYYANALLFLNNFDYKETNILGAIILKWVKQEKITFIKKETGLFKKETSCLDLTHSPTFDLPNEKKLFDLMYEASEDGILEPKEFEKWARYHYNEFFNLFANIKNDEITRLETIGHIHKRIDKNECKKKNVMDDIIYEESKKLYGLKKFLQEFSNINTRETIEVHIWDEYLMFAYLFGIADKVAKQLKNLYPELLQQNNIDFDTIIIINNISSSTTKAASGARSAAEHYSSGGGGFSSGGGGGGSFGGGGFSGGGSR